VDCRALRTGFAMFALAVLAGCLGTSRPAVRAWTVEPPGSDVASRPPVRLDELTPPPFKATRLGGISVLPPYDGAAMRVKRADGTLAEDSYNVFAAPPAQLLRRPVMGALANEPRFGRVLPPVSSASSEAVAEVLVSELALDCRDGRKAVVRLGMNVVKGRDVVLSAEASGSADAASGDYSEAFSKAFNDALRESLVNLK